MGDDFSARPTRLLISGLSGEAAQDMRDLVRASVTEALAKDREMRKLEFLSSLKAAPAPVLPLVDRVGLAWRVLRGARVSER
jgi:hypothetical protein